MTAQIEETTLGQLQSNDQANLLDAIDETPLELWHRHQQWNRSVARRPANNINDRNQDEQVDDRAKGGSAGWISAGEVKLRMGCDYGWPLHMLWYAENSAVKRGKRE